MILTVFLQRLLIIQHAILVITSNSHGEIPGSTSGMTAAVYDSYRPPFLTAASYSGISGEDWGPGQIGPVCHGEMRMNMHMWADLQQQTTINGILMLQNLCYQYQMRGPKDGHQHNNR